MDSADLVYLGQQLVKAGRTAVHERPGLQVAESMVVKELSERRFSTITELAKRTGYAQSRISKAVAVLREQGVVATRTDSEDRRRSVVYLVELAGDEGGGRAPSADQVLERLLSGATPPRRRAIVTALEELLALLRVGEPGEPSELLLQRWARELGISAEKLDQMTSRQLAELVGSRSPRGRAALPGVDAGPDQTGFDGRA